MASFSSPSDLCRDLNLSPTAGQCALMESLADRRGIADAPLRWREDAGETFRAAVMVVLWRVLRDARSRATILAPSEPGAVECGELGRLAMGFLSEVCATRDEGLRAASRFESWNRIEFGTEVGWEVRLIPNHPFLAAEAARRSTIGLIIDAGSPQTALAEASKAFEDAFDRENGLLIRLW